MSSSERIKELKIDSTLWADPKRIINLFDFDSKKLSIYTNASSKDLTEIYEVRYDNGGLYLVIDDIKGSIVGSILSLILTDDQKINIIKYGKKFLKMLMMEMEN